MLNYNDTSAGSNYASQAAGSPNFITFRLNAVPEPSALGLVLITCASLGLRRRRRSA
ncbi:MAG: PEP-CTERM sorting domain-containing protein [Planctomycetota bacterium]